MSNVEFDENNFPANNFASQSSTPFLPGLIIKLGMAKTEKQANYVLVTIAVCAFLLTLYVIFKS